MHLSFLHTCLDTVLLKTVSGSVEHQSRKDLPEQAWLLLKSKGERAQHGSEFLEIMSPIYHLQMVDVKRKKCIRIMNNMCLC